MSASLLAFALAAWLTGMIPIFAADACGGLGRLSFFERFAIYAFGPIVLLIRIWPFLLGAGLRLRP